MKNNPSELQSSSNKRCVHLHELIDELENTSGIKRDEAIRNAQTLLSIIKENLADGHNINLGELGILTHHQRKDSKIPEIRYTPSLPFLSELKDKYKDI